ncbi:MAG: TrkH family potassium uptake protein [Hyphomicrobiaceae bacterium]
MASATKGGACNPFVAAHKAALQAICSNAGAATKPMPFNARLIQFVVGLLLCFIALAMIIPLVIDLIDHNDDWRVFLVSSSITFFCGGLLAAAGWSERTGNLTVKDGFIITTSCWVVVTVFCAIPFVGLGVPFTDAYFEAMSGLTTTGSTVLTKLDLLPRGMLMWRALLNGMGGLGIIAMAVILLPFLRIGGMQLFQMESSDKSEKITPRMTELVAAMAAIYGALIVLCAIIYLLFGMSLFDAVCHALATLATGGFSTHDASFGFFGSAPIEWAATLFMIMGALPFVWMIKVLRGNTEALRNDQQVRGFLLFIGVVSLGLALWLVEFRGEAFWDALRKTAFNVVSIVTTTGFASEDYTAWGPFTVGVFFILTFVGGCAGSTAGGIKIYRLQIAGMLTRTYLLQLIKPHRIVPKAFNGRPVSEQASFSVVAFLTVYLFSIGIFTLLLTGTGLDLLTALSASAQAISNVGPGLGEIVGPAGNFATLPATAKWVLSGAMLLGRLELFTVLVLFRPEFWVR